MNEISTQDTTAEMQTFYTQNCLGQPSWKLTQKANSLSFVRRRWYQTPVFILIPAFFIGIALIIFLKLNCPEKYLSLLALPMSSIFIFKGQKALKNFKEIEITRKENELYFNNQPIAQIELKLFTNSEKYKNGKFNAPSGHTPQIYTLLEFTDTQNKKHQLSFHYKEQKILNFIKDFQIKTSHIIHSEEALKELQKIENYLKKEL